MRILFDMYALFQETYYGTYSNEPMFTPQEFQEIATFIHINCSRQKKTVVLRVEQYSTPNDITAYCVVLHEK